MEKIPTAESSKWKIDDYIESIINSNCKEIPYEGTEINKYGIKQSFVEFLLNHRIEFAKLHVQAALKEASEKAIAQSTRSNISSRNNQLICIHLGEVYINKDSILNAYPLGNIK